MHHEINPNLKTGKLPGDLYLFNKDVIFTGTYQGFAEHFLRRIFAGNLHFLAHILLIRKHT